MKRTLTLLAGLAMLAAPLMAHHGRGATYDDKKLVKFKATVTEVAWRNPHVAIYVDAKDESGKVVNWGLESQNVSSLSRIGFFRNTLQVGQEVTVICNPARSGAAVGVIRKIYDAAGKEVLSFGGSIDQ
jgi:hypothetical protein